MRELIERNGLDAGDLVVSCIFTLTDDLDAEFPAVAARAAWASAACRCCAPARSPVPGRAAARDPRADPRLRRRAARAAARLPRRGARRCGSDLEGAQ